MSNLVDAEAYRYLDNLLEHKQLVGIYLQRMIAALTLRAVVHDFSKFGPEELEPYAAMLSRFEQAEYGSEEYKACCRAIKPALDHHLSHNTHHPEYYHRGIAGMNLLDVVEMVCDWIAASQRAGDKLIRLDLQRERFDISDDLYRIICHTVRELVSEDHGIVVVE